MVRCTLMIKGNLRFHYRTMSIGIVSALVACAGSTWDGQVYRGDTVAFRAGRVPPSWRRLDDDSSLLTFRDAARDLLISVNGRCGKDGDDVPLEALTQHLFVYFTERQISDQRRIGPRWTCRPAHAIIRQARRRRPTLRRVRAQEERLRI